MSGWFERAVEIVLEAEGVLSEDARDDGGLTKYGISQKAYPALDIRALTRLQAIDIYRRDYWNRVRGDDLAWAFALPVFDCAVNQGAGTAVKLFQKALRVPADGDFGPKTLAVAHASQSPPDAVLARFMAKRVLRYAEHPDWPTFGDGWVIRCFTIALHAKGA